LEKTTHLSLKVSQVEYLTIVKDDTNKRVRIWVYCWKQ